jgi:predicted TIM-barrel fold metal-dependent hydrolase
MTDKHITPGDLKDKIIDCHSHIGIALKPYACREYPYAQTIEGLYYRQKSAGVDVNVVFPASASLFFDPAYFKTGEMRPAKNPLSPFPFAIENEMLMLDVFEFNPEHKDRFITFVSVDPEREVNGQLDTLRELEERFPIYGIKISPVECQSKITSLLDEGKPFLDYAAESNIPFLLHTTSDPLEEYSYAGMTFKVIDRNPHLRFCLAHCIGFDREFLERADALSNVWVDTSALKIQVQCAYEGHPAMASAQDRLEGDYSDHIKIMGSLMEQYPDTIIWGSDSPWYAFTSRRKQGEDQYLTFHLKGRYEEEKAALDSLSEGLRMKACNANTLKFLFGT